MSETRTKHLAFRLDRLPSGALVLLITEGVRKLRTTRYHLAEVDRVEADRAFEVRKFLSDGGTGEYHGVCLTEAGTSWCTCRGNSQWQHCRHQDALRHLIDTGEL